MKNINVLKRELVNNPLFHYTVLPLYRAVKYVVTIPYYARLYRETAASIRNVGDKNRIYYLGVPEHANLGDLAQGVCIRRWIKKHYPECEMVGIKTAAIVNSHRSVLPVLKKHYRAQDMILFQSGYTTTDLGGDADEMHCRVIQSIPDARILMMPQTVFFKSPKRKARTARIYNSARNMLFLARDAVSYADAQQMFPDICVKQYPDIVTSLIGQKTYDTRRSGILFCCRDDEEKFYSDAVIGQMMEGCAAHAAVERTDTTIYVNPDDVVAHAEERIMEEIEKYAHYRLIVTDRYHGTIFSLVAGTPVIIIKTTDHKVTTGADWFKGIYDDYVYLAETPEDVPVLAEQILSKDLSHRLAPHFDETYYDQLPNVMQETGGVL